MSDTEFKYFWERPPLCFCGTVMQLNRNVARYICGQCRTSVSLLGAKSNLPSLSNHEKYLIDMIRYENTNFA